MVVKKTEEVFYRDSKGRITSWSENLTWERSQNETKIVIEQIRYWLDSDCHLKNFEVKTDPGKILAMLPTELLLGDLGNESNYALSGQELLLWDVAFK